MCISEKVLQAVVLKVKIQFNFIVCHALNMKHHVDMIIFRFYTRILMFKLMILRKLSLKINKLSYWCLELKKLHYRNANYMFEAVWKHSLKHIYIFQL